MGQVRNGSAPTTYAVRTAVQRSQASTHALRRGTGIQVQFNLREASIVSLIKFASKRVGNLARERLAVQFYRVQ